MFPLVFALSFSACGWRQKASETPPTVQPFAGEESKSAIPFQTREPENFQADFVVTTGAVENKTFTARRGGDYRFDYNLSGNLKISNIKTADGKSFLIIDSKKIYAENSGAAAEQISNDSADFPTNQWLNAKADAEFTNLGAENGLTKYRVNLDASRRSETIVFVDENIKLPVRQEFYSTGDGERSLFYTVEMRNFKLRADADLFEIPADYKRVSLENLRAVVKKEGFGEQ